MDEPLMRIGEIAAFFGVSVKAMRIYEKMSILKPIKVDEETGYRYYHADQVRQLDALLELKQLGFSLAEIKELIKDGMTKERYMEALVHKKIMWTDKIADAEGRIDLIDEIIEKLATTRPATKMHGLTEEERAHLLSKMASLESYSNSPNILSEALWV